MIAIRTLAAGAAVFAAAAASASIDTFKYTGSVTSTSGNGYLGFIPALGTPVTAYIQLDMSLNYIGNSGTQTNAFPALASGFKVIVGSDTFWSSNYGVYVQNQNFANNAQLAVQASGNNIYWNSVQQSNVGGPSLNHYSFTPAFVGLTPFSPLDLTAPWDITQSGGRIDQFTAQSGAVYWTFASVERVPAPASAAVLAALPLIARRRR